MKDNTGRSDKVYHIRELDDTIMNYFRVLEKFLRLVLTYSKPTTYRLDIRLKGSLSIIAAKDETSSRGRL